MPQPYLVVTHDHASDRPQSKGFDTFDAALAYGETIDPFTTHGHLTPNLPAEVIARYERRGIHYEKGLFDASGDNRYGVIFKRREQ